MHLTSRLSVSVVLFCLLTLWGCTRKSVEGESCGRTDDCEKPLRCVALVCVGETTTSKDAKTSTPNQPEATPTPPKATPKEALHVLVVNQPLMLTPAEGQSTPPLAHLSLSEAGLFAIEAKGPAPIGIELRKEKDSGTQALLTSFGMDPEMKSVRLDRGDWYLRVQSIEPCTLWVRPLDEADAPPHNPAGIVPTVNDQKQGPQN